MSKIVLVLILVHLASIGKAIYNTMAPVWIPCPAVQAFGF